MWTKIIGSVPMAMFKQDKVTLDLKYNQERIVGRQRTLITKKQVPKTTK